MPFFSKSGRPKELKFWLGTLAHSHYHLAWETEAGELLQVIDQPNLCRKNTAPGKFCRGVLLMCEYLLLTRNIKFSLLDYKALLGRGFQLSRSICSLCVRR